jgi:3',5'-cyclic AMP phosphodiesterase CpdA
MRLAWATDVHLEFAEETMRSIFAKEIINQKADALLLTGDIANSKLIDRLLRELQERIDIPIYFNMGNHDFYGGHISLGRRWAEDITKSDVPLFWIEGAGPVPLGDDVGLVGVDGWGDGQLGSPYSSDVLLNDWDLIKEFAKEDALYNREARMKLLRRYGNRARVEICAQLRNALPRFKRLLLMTHVPPWKEATWHEGAHSNDDWLPWFSCKAVGDAIVEEAAKYGDRQITVLCGHTHGKGYSRINHQVDVHTGGARYRSPEVQCSFQIIGDVIARVGSSNWHSTGY